VANRFIILLRQNFTKVIRQKTFQQIITIETVIAERKTYKQVSTDYNLVYIITIFVPHYGTSKYTDLNFGAAQGVRGRIKRRKEP
jgi:hypothetical protein